MITQSNFLTIKFTKVECMSCLTSYQTKLRLKILGNEEKFKKSLKLSTA